MKQQGKIFRGSRPPDPPTVEGPSGLRQIYLPVTLKYPLVQKLIETPAYQFLKILANCMESMLFHCFYDC